MKQENILKNSRQKENKHELTNTNFESKFSRAVYKFLSSLVSKVEIKIAEENEESGNNNEEKKKFMNKLTNEISKKILDYKNKDIVLSNLGCANNLDNNIDNEFYNNENPVNIEEEERNIKNYFLIQIILYSK